MMVMNLFFQQVVELRATVIEPPDIGAVDHPNQPISLLKVIPPV
jgi:hypothetical protein